MNFRESWEYPKNYTVLADSGGFQLATGQAGYIDPEAIIETEQKTSEKPKKKLF